MPETPSIKGSVYQTAHEDVNKLLADGSLGREEAARWLEPSDFERLGKPVNIAAWYDIRSYDRLCRLLCDVEGGGDVDYLCEKGRQTARRLRASGLYGQMEQRSRAGADEAASPEQRMAIRERELRRTNTLSATLYNFAKWSVERDPEWPERLQIAIDEAEALPETLVWRIQGFMNEMAREQTGADLWDWRREGARRIVFRMTRDV